MCCGSTFMLTNNVIAENRTVSGRGSGLVIRESSPHLLHTTIASNSGDDGSGVYVFSMGSGSSTVALTNTILVSHSAGISVTGGNTVTVNGLLWYDTPITVSQSITSVMTVRNQYKGDPAFATDGYHIGPDSAAVNRGAVTGLVTDIDGEVRPAPPGTKPDLGADEVSQRRVFLPLTVRSS